MSDFARAQLLKYGWTEGKGLGKNENGIAEALKPKLKFDTSGIGHKQVDYEWWSSVYDKALKNIVLDKESDEVSISVAKENAFNISSSKSGLEVSKKKRNLRYGKFLKTSTLQNGNMTKDETCESIEEDSKNDSTIPKISDEELFQACGGRTAHKGARHGLTLNGKLARVAEQERQLLFNSALKSEENNSELTPVQKKFSFSKKRKRCAEREHSITLKNDYTLDEDEHVAAPLPLQIEDDYQPSKKSRKKVKRKIDNLTQQLNLACTIEDAEKSSKMKYEQKNNLLDNDVYVETHKKKSKKKVSVLHESVLDLRENEITSTSHSELVKSKNKCKKEKCPKKGKICKNGHCINAEAQRLNAKIKLKKSKRRARKEKKKLDKLSESLFAVTLNSDLTKGNVNIAKKIKSHKKKCKKDKSKQD